MYLFHNKMLPGHIAFYYTLGAYLTEPHSETSFIFFPPSTLEFNELLKLEISVTVL